jgi:hypothetical protein
MKDRKAIAKPSQIVEMLVVCGVFGNKAQQKGQKNESNKKSEEIDH